MKGLIQKDFYLIMRHAKFLLLYILLFAVVFSFSGSGELSLSGFLSLVSFMLIINCFAYDEQAGFDKRIAASPLSRAKIVWARYLSAFLLWGIGIVLTTALDIVLGLVRRNPPEPLILLQNAVISLGIAVFFMAILFPLIYRYGVNKSRLLLLIVTVAPVLALMLFGGRLEENVPALPPAFVQMLPWAIAAILLLGLWLSVSLSVRIYERKEF